MSNQITATEKIGSGLPNTRNSSHMTKDTWKNVPDFPNLKSNLKSNLISGSTLSASGFQTQIQQTQNIYRKPFLSVIPTTIYDTRKNSIISKMVKTTKIETEIEKIIKDSSKLSKLSKSSKFDVKLIRDIEGAPNTDQIIPPDAHGAAGPHHFVEVTGDHITIIEKDDPLKRKSISLSVFFNYFVQPFIDPRVIYDHKHNRWIITTAALPESGSVQFHFIGVSKTKHATDPFFIYAVNVNFNSGDLWDFPQLGMDEKSIIITANIFDSKSNFKGADMFAVAKSRLYKGRSFSVPIFTGLIGTLTPPIVIDDNNNNNHSDKNHSDKKTFLITAFAPNNVLNLYTLKNSHRPHHISLTGPIDIEVEPYDIPPSAQQMGTDAVLDTLDGRFINTSTQTKDYLWQVHTIALSTFAAPKFYQIDINRKNPKVIRSGFFRSDKKSFDFNASIVANKDNDIFFTWTSTNPSKGINAQIRFSGFCHKENDRNNHNHNLPIGPGKVVFTSIVPFQDFRWGDYSSVVIDPLNKRKAWIVNEGINSPNDWNTHISKIELVKKHRHH